MLGAPPPTPRDGLHLQIPGVDSAELDTNKSSIAEPGRDVTVSGRGHAAADRQPVRLSISLDRLKQNIQRICDHVLPHNDLSYVRSSISQHAKRQDRVRRAKNPRVITDSSQVLVQKIMKMFNNCRQHSLTE